MHASAARATIAGTRAENFGRHRTGMRVHDEDAVNVERLMILSKSQIPSYV